MKGTFCPGRALCDIKKNTDYLTYYNRGMIRIRVYAQHGIDLYPEHTPEMIQELIEKVSPPQDWSNKCSTSRETEPCIPYTGFSVWKKIGCFISNRPECM